jgi:hypothetical protein
MFQRTLTKQGLKFKLSTKVVEGEVGDSSVKLTLEPSKGGEQEHLEADVVLVSAGERRTCVGCARGPHCTCDTPHPPHRLRLLLDRPACAAPFLHVTPGTVPCADGGPHDLQGDGRSRMAWGSTTSE